MRQAKAAMLLKMKGKIKMLPNFTNKLLPQRIGSSAVLVLVLSAVFSQQANALTITGTDSFDGSEATMAPRFFRSGTPGDPCTEFSSGNFQYKTVDFTSDASGQLTVDFDPQTCGTGIFVTFHQGAGAFNPANICSNFTWAFGSSAAFTGQTFPVPPNSPMTMVVSGVANAPGVACGPYSYQIDGTGAAPVAAPVMGSMGTVLLASMLGLMGAVLFGLKRRSKQSIG